jgi:hypothetical protein
MTALKSINHERFCRALRRKILAGEAQGAARLAAYLETMYRGDNPQGIAVEANARRLSNRSDVKARLEELILHSSSQKEPELAHDLNSIDPMIVDVLKRLPAPGAEWPEPKRKLWLRLVEETFDVVYRSEERAADEPGGEGGVARETRE